MELRTRRDRSESDFVRLADPDTNIAGMVGRLGAERGVIIDMTKVPEGVAALYGL